MEPVLLNGRPWMKRKARDLVPVLLAACVLTTACAARSRDARPAAADSRPNTLYIKNSAAAKDGGTAVVPIEALDLLRKSVSDSCSICREESREKAFRLLDASLLPGRLVGSAGEDRFRLAPGGENELLLSSLAGAAIDVTFRFHTAANRLAGIADSDLTGDETAASVFAAPDGSRLRGAIEIIPFAYGDGEAYLFSRSAARLQVQCRIREMAAE